MARSKLRFGGLSPHNKFIIGGTELLSGNQRSPLHPSTRSASGFVNREEEKEKGKMIQDLVGPYREHQYD